MKKSLSILLCLIIICTMIYIPSVEASIDLATFNSKLTAFKNERYGHGSIYQDNPNLTGGYQCFGYANELALYIWGSYPTKSMSAASVNSGWNVAYGGSAVDNLCIGDIVRYRYHSIFITGISGDTIYYCHANSPSGTNKVTYDNTIARSTLKSRVSEQLTSPNTTKTGWVAHYTNGLSPSIPEEPDTDELEMPTISLEKTEWMDYETIKFSWQECKSADYYYPMAYDSNNNQVDVQWGCYNTYYELKLPAGEYDLQVVSVRVDDNGEKTTNWSGRRKITVVKGVEMPEISFEKAAWLDYETIKFSWQKCENAKYYYPMVYDSNNNQIDVLWGCYNTYYEVKLPAGEYDLQVVSVRVDDNGEKITNWSGRRKITVSKSVEMPSISLDKTEWMDYETIKFSWQKCENAKYYYPMVYDSNNNQIDVLWGCYNTYYEVKLPAGEYDLQVVSVRVDENGEKITNWSGRRKITVATGVEMPSISLEKTEWMDYETIRFSWQECGGAKYYYPMVYDSNNNQIDVLWGCYNTYYEVKLPAGEYDLQVVSVRVDENGEKITNWSGRREITVVTGVEMPSISLEKTEWLDYEAIRFSWQECGGADYYYPMVYDANDNIVAVQWGRYGTDYSATLPTGEYDLQVVSVREDDNGEKITNWSGRRKITVTKSDRRTESIITKNGIKHSVKTTLYDFVAPYDLLIVGYKGNQFVTMKRVPHNEQNSPYTLEGDIDKIKVMVWSDLSTIKPLCEAEEITSDEFIIE